MHCPVCEFPLSDPLPAECSNCRTSLKPLAFVRALPQRYLERARQHAATGAVREAIADAEAAASLDPARLEARVLLAELWEANGDITQARRTWRQVVAAEPTYPEAARWRRRLRQTVWREQGRRALVLLPLLLVGGLWVRDGRARTQQTAALTARVESAERVAAEQNAKATAMRKEIEDLKRELKGCGKAQRVRTREEAYRLQRQAVALGGKNQEL
jgi:hypothetical protein